MNNFNIFRNKGSNNNKYPFLLIVQNDILQDLKSRVVIPLIEKIQITDTLKILNPEIKINNNLYILLTQQITTVPISIIGSIVEPINIDRITILNAIDFLITGF